MRHCCSHAALAVVHQATDSADTAVPVRLDLRRGAYAATALAYPNEPDFP
jgi:hypothetical protein